MRQSGGGSFQVGESDGRHIAAGGSGSSRQQSGECPRECGRICTIRHRPCTCPDLW